MNSTSLNISNKINFQIVDLFSRISTVTESLNLPYVVVGASARDIIFHFVYGSKIVRATEDIDFGVQVPDWLAFNSLKENLVKKGFKETGSPHRLIFNNQTPIDIVPFGKIEDKNANISWPPAGEMLMNVLGFKEAFDNSCLVCIQENPEVKIPIASPEGMILLKLIAWQDRSIDVRSKDAKDILYLLKTYEEIPDINTLIYNNEELINSYNWDPVLAGAYVLGKKAFDIALDKTKFIIRNLINDDEENLLCSQLIDEMSSIPEVDFTENKFLISAFKDGFNFGDK